MRNNILTILCAAACALSITGCEAEHIGFEPTNQPITFTTPEGWAPFTKAEGDGITDFAENQFGVYAYYTAPNSETKQKFMVNQEVKREDAASSWSYSPIKYWLQNGTLDFYAYAPYATTLTDGKPTWTLDGKQDILTASTLGLTTPAPIVFTFEHQLSQFRFQFKKGATGTDLEGRKVTKVTLTGFPESATLNTETGTLTFSDGTIGTISSEEGKYPIPTTEGETTPTLLAGGNSISSFGVQVEIENQPMASQTVTLPEGKFIEPGKIYLLEITLTVTEISKIIISQFTDWENESWDESFTPAQNPDKFSPGVADWSTVTWVEEFTPPETDDTPIE